MPKADVPGFEKAATDWTNQTTSVLDERNNAWAQANADYQNQMSAYDRAVQQAQQAQAARTITDPYGTNSLFKTRVY
jgi:hypothetical protein